MHDLDRADRRTAEILIDRAEAAGRDILAEITTREADTIRPVPAATRRVYAWVRTILTEREQQR